MSETAALATVFSFPSPLYSFSRRVDGKFVSELYKCGFSECQCVTRVRKYAADVSLEERKKFDGQKTRACVGSDANKREEGGGRGHF